MSKSLFDIVSELDNFPYYEEAPTRFTETLKSYHAFKVQGIDATLGYIPNTLIRSISWPKEHWLIDSGTIVLINPPDSAASTRTRIVQDAINRMIEAGCTNILKGWRNEQFPVYGPSGDVILEIERSASSLFGILTSGVQMLCYVKDANGIQLWIAKRSMQKQTYPGMLDCTAAGALSTGESPRSAMILEATDEASIAREIIESGMTYVGAISYFHMKGSSVAFGSEGCSTTVLLPEVEYLFELQLDEDTVPQPKDSEVENFRLWNVDQVLDALGRGLFKPNSAVVVIDFFIRHGVITPETEPMYEEIKRRLHRRLPFPTADRST